MFQVASHPGSHFSSQDAYVHSHSHPTMSSMHQRAPPNLQLPRKLARPNFVEISRDTIIALEPELEEVPIEYIRRHLAGQADQMLSALSLLSFPNSLPRSRLPPALDAPLRPTPNSPRSSAFPTHLLAVLSSRSSASSPATPTAATFAAHAPSPPASSAVPLYPTHALVLAAYCTSLPALPPSKPSSRRANITLPIVPLAVPSADAFPPLHAFLHTRRADVLLASLLPALGNSFPTPPSSQSSSHTSSSYVSQFNSEWLLRLAQTLASDSTTRYGGQGALAALMGNAKAVNGLWKNVCALGIFDAELWGIMDIAWEIVLAALTRVAERERA